MFWADYINIIIGERKIARDGEKVLPRG